MDKAQKLNEWLGMGIGLFQAGTVLFLNGIVLSTLYYGGYLLTTQELTPGDLMAFLVSTQTIQRSLGQMSLLFGQFVRGIIYTIEILLQNYCRVKMNVIV